MTGIRPAINRRWHHYIHMDPRRMSRPEIVTFVLTGALLSFGASAAVIVTGGPFAALHAVENAQLRWQWLLLTPAGIVISHAGYTLAYREVARFRNGPDLARRDAVTLVASGFGAFNLHGGFGLDQRSLTDFGLGPDQARLRVLVLGMVEYTVLAPAAFVAALVLTMQHQPSQGGVLPSWTIGFPAGAAFVMALLVTRRFVARRRSSQPTAARSGRRRPRWLVPLDRTLQAVEMTLSFVGSWPGGPLAVAGMAVYWAGEIVALGACLAVFAPGHASVAALILGYATGYALTRRTLPLAGAGAVESLLPFALFWVSYPLAAAAVAVVAYRVVNLWLTVIPAGAGLRRLRRRWRTTRGLGPIKKRKASAATS